MVALPGFADVPVYLDNRLAGRTDGSGYLLLPSLRPYERNQVRIDVDALPLDATVRGTETVAIPYARSGMTVQFDVARSHPATARFVDRAGASLPAGTVLAEAGGAASALVGRDGFSQIDGLGDQPTALVATLQSGEQVSCPVPAPPPGAQPDLGVVTCR